MVEYEKKVPIKTYSIKLKFFDFALKLVKKALIGLSKYFYFTIVTQLFQKAEAVFDIDREFRTLFKEGIDTTNNFFSRGRD